MVEAACNLVGPGRVVQMATTRNNTTSGPQLTLNCWNCKPSQLHSCGIVDTRADSRSDTTCKAPSRKPDSYFHPQEILEILAILLGVYPISVRLDDYIQYTMTSYTMLMKYARFSSHSAGDEDHGGDENLLHWPVLLCFSRDSTRRLLPRSLLPIFH